ncbi:MULTISPECIES: DUF4011 domain-containing protein [unclassified Brevibacterium]|uniref:DUF4011 domain-containing protein n=1 Tax=unclassified Brevibacterium TaxID=2614124 RepID=UPI00196B4481|nr:DUF4011 domain-containing protein [Brevibacterium sp. S111]
MSDSVADEQFPELGEVFAEWKKQAAHLGGRDTMLHFRDSRDGSIDLSGAHPSGLAQLLAGRATRLSSLIRDHDILADARRRAKSIRSKAEQLDNERGIRAAHLAIGLASWTEKDAKYKFNAPVVMRHITLVPRGSRVEDYEIVLGNEITINPALVQHLHEEYDLEVPVDDWIDATGGAQGFDPGPALDRLRELGQSVPGLRVNHRLIISTFANIATPFSTDYLPTQHPVLRALAGDEDVRANLGGPSYVPQAAEAGDTLSPAEEKKAEAASNDPVEPEDSPAKPETETTPDADDKSAETLTDSSEKPGDTDEKPVEPGWDEDDYGQPTVPITDEPLSAASPEDSATTGSDESTDSAVASTEPAAGRAPGSTDDESAADAVTESDATDPQAATTITGTDSDGNTVEESQAADADSDTAEAESTSDDDVVPAALKEPITPLPDRKPQEEFLVIDVDGDQQAVVDAAVSGRSVVVDTPPGTGATQVAVAVATTLAHTGKSVLFLAQTSDALDSFSSRLDEVGLSDFAVDTRKGSEDIRRQLIGLIGSAEKSERPDLSKLLNDLNEQRATLADHVSSLHRRRAPWDVSVYETMQHLAELTSGDDSPQTPVRFGEDILGASEDRRNALRGKLGELASLGAFTLDVEDTVWFGADLKSVDEAEAARTVAERIGRMIPDLVEATEPVLQKAKLNPRRNVDDWARAIRVLLRVRKTLDSFAPDVYDHRLDDLIAATGTPEYRTEVGVEMGMMQRRRLKKSAAEFLRPGAEVADLHSALIDVRSQRVILSDLAGHDGRPQIPRGVLEADEILQSVEADMAKLSPILETTPDGGDLGSMLIEELQARTEAMGRDSENLAELPERSRLQRELDAEGLSDLMADLRRRKVDDSLVGPEFDLAYWASVLQTMAGEDPAIGRHDGDALHQVAEDFRENDRAFVAAGASRLRYNHAQAWKRGIEADPIAAGVIKQELLSKHTSVNRISTQAPELLTTLAPVWMGSPYTVPELFSALPLFDAVVIADAGRLSVVDVVPGITRARQVISLGDSRLLGPRPFSIAVDRFGMDDGNHPRSVQDHLGEFLPRMRLSNSYRLSPVGLIDLANRHFYDSTISTLPTAHTGEGSGLEFSYVADGRGPTDIGTGRVESPDAEVKRVVELVLKHARNRSRESLAVVALTQHHAQRVATAISRAMKDLPYVAAFFSDSTKEPFVVTDAERVQGMSRDAVIFTLGYGRTVHGRVIHDFGALSGPDGRRILAATMTRARKRLTLVSSIEADDFERSRLSGGAAMLPQLLEEIATGGVSQPGPHGEIYDPLMGDIADRLLQLGVVAHEHYNGIDLAVANSAEDEHGMIIAVAGDGPEYASMRSLRQRDRVLPEQLSRRGWKFMRVWSTDAFVDPQTETEKIFDVWRTTVETMSPQAVLNAARAASVVVGRTGSRPKLVPGLPMHKYSAEGLDEMIDWIQSDAVVRGDGEIKDLLRTALAQKGSSTRGDSRLQAAVDRYRERHAQAKKVTGSEVLIPRSGSTGPVEDDILPTFDTGKIRADELRSAGLVQTASNDQVAEAADGADAEATSDSAGDDAAESAGDAKPGSEDSAQSESKNDDA